MNFAVLGADSESLLLAQAAINSGHAITWGGDLGGIQDSPLISDISVWLPKDDQDDNWESLLDQHACDAVIVGRGETSGALRAEQVNQLIKNGVAVLATFPLCESVLSFYEIDMARCESKSTLYHFNPLTQQSALLDEVARWVREGHPEVGSVEKVVWDRPLEQRTQESVLWHFARDIEVLDQVAGPLDRLGAVGSPDTAATYAGLSVQLLGKCQVPVHWSVGPVENPLFPRLTIVGERGKWRTELPESTEEKAAQAKTCLAQFVDAVSGESSVKTTWPAALRAMELTDTIEISLRRGRMIDVHRQQLSEQLAFRGTMSAVGCGVLLLLPPLLLVMGWLAEQVGLPVAQYWAHGLLALLAAFLLIQVIPKLFLGSSTEENQED
ncbi:Gfo/Idh/MocA family oxidoreductase [Bythopirellula goksoeyrii]|uniref:Uncharacterized protein n=1 Tax=Bythopirellula goksoeyrii TaxID=1400387 RepID=A0A5B9QMZ8_9BACT|nr:hypothetical protein [Bythopirellula goksoeyrii]QEG35373.1 hypothetical protein Pr1d_26710 [Bythopirellula goksoeyrii]